MNKPAAPDDQGSSTRPYLIRALHDWCTDNGFTPYIAVHVSAGVQVPMEYVKNNEIVLNIGFEATSGMKLGNDFIEFRARFGGVARDIVVPIDHVVAIYARENGQGMAFPAPTASESGATAGASEAPRAGLRLAAQSADNAAADKLSTPTAREPQDQGNPADAGITVLDADPDDLPPTPPPLSGRPSLKRVK